MILSLSGWGQKPNSLDFIFKESSFDPFFVRNFDYAKFNNLDSFFKDFVSQKFNPKIVIGWSLGGQLALRLIEKQIVNPQLLVLISPPFQMVKDSKIIAGMSQKNYEEFYKNFSISPTKTLKQFAILAAMNDRNAKEIAKNLDINEDNFANLEFWLAELKRFSCFDLDFKNMPRTLFLQGEQDMIVHKFQSDYFKKRIKNFRLEMFEKCGHAPHLNDLKRVRELILEEIAFTKVHL